MKTVWKYCLEAVDYQVLKLPCNAEILTVQLQNGVPQLWAIVDTELSKEERIIRIVGTGHEIDYDESKEQIKYIATFQMNNGAFVFHVFEVIKMKLTKW